jgi:hypothetical protein
MVGGPRRQFLKLLGAGGLWLPLASEASAQQQIQPAQRRRARCLQRGALQCGADFGANLQGAEPTRIKSKDELMAAFGPAFQQASLAVPPGVLAREIVQRELPP